MSEQGFNDRFKPMHIAYSSVQPRSPASPGPYEEEGTDKLLDISATNVKLKSLNKETKKA